MMQTLADYLASGNEVRLDETAEIDMTVARLLPESLARRFCLAAITELDEHIVVAMANPLDVIARDTVRLNLHREIKVAISSREEILAAIGAIYHGSDLAEQRLRNLAEAAVTTTEDDSSLEENLDTNIDIQEAAKGQPVIQYVNLLLFQAVKSRASDIHVEPQERSTIVRMRIDGVLQKTIPPPQEMWSAVVARIKILSNIDISEHRLPQDGRMKVRVSDRDVDVRVSVLPTRYGGKVVMRILDPSAVAHDMNQLGLETRLLEDFKNILSQPYGIIIVTGPTGSGKSTTLYSALNYLKDPKINITTIEDPIEYSLDEINQVQVKPEINLDFALCLRAILRQDPDIILVGEIRDKETVDIAIQASLTGHLVLATFHTNSAPGAITRLVKMGIEPYLLASSLNLVVAQRLVRRICEHCKEPIDLNDEVLKRLKIEPEQSKDTVFYHGQGCKTCRGTGYSGRLPIFEFLVMDDEIRDELIAGASESQIRAMSRRKGYGGLLQSGINKILQGLTTAEEVLGVTFAGDKANNNLSPPCPAEMAEVGKNAFVNK